MRRGRCCLSGNPHAAQRLALRALKSVLKELRKELGSIPILFTFRTAGEGGEKDIRPGKDRSEGSGLGIEADSREFLTRDE